MTKVIFFGSIGIARKCLEFILCQDNIQLLGACCDKDLSRWREEESVYSFCVANGIPVYELPEIVALNPDLGISVRYNRIIPETIINMFEMGIVNTHGGLLPEYRGSYCNINSILNNDTVFGVTLHYIEKGVDEGDVIALKGIPIPENCTGFDLYLESERLCLEIITENLHSLIDGTNTRKSQNDLIVEGHKTRTYYSAPTLRKKEIKYEDLSDSINVIRAFDSPYHKPAYTHINGKIIYLRTNYNENRK